MEALTYSITPKLSTGLVQNVYVEKNNERNRLPSVEITGSSFSRSVLLPEKLNLPV
jgi:hypothetical protein